MRDIRDVVDSTVQCLEVGAEPSLALVSRKSPAAFPWRLFFLTHLRPFSHCLKREEGRERNSDAREKHDWLPPVGIWTSIHPHDWDLPHPDRKSNLQCFSYRRTLQPSEPHQPGPCDRITWCDSHVFRCLLHYVPFLVCVTNQGERFPNRVLIYHLNSEFLCMF